MDSYYFYLFPLLVSVSLAYGATRHELMKPILEHAFRFGIWFIGFVAVIYLIVLMISWSL
ncbi:MAG: hypothetical protein ACI9G1_000018 [Pirellulaceae bacterium]|jgi:hypothetical protein